MKKLFVFGLIGLIFFFHQGCKKDIDSQPNDYTDLCKVRPDGDDEIYTTVSHRFLTKHIIYGDLICYASNGNCLPTVVITADIDNEAWASKPELVTFPTTKYFFQGNQDELYLFLKKSKSMLAEVIRECFYESTFDEIKKGNERIYIEENTNPNNQKDHRELFIILEKFTIENQVGEGNIKAVIPIIIPSI